MKTSKFVIFFSVESYDKQKLQKNDHNCYVAEKGIVSKLSMILISNLNIINCVKKLWQNITFLSVILSEKYAVNERHGRARSGLFRVLELDDSASTKMIMKMYFKFSRFFLKILELFECCRGDLYIMTVNRSLIRFAHS